MATRPESILCALIVTAAFWLGLSCGQVDGGGCDPQAPTPRNCNPDAGLCGAISIGGDPVAPSASFRGYADPSLLHDPLVSGHIWLAYSWPHITVGQAPDGGVVHLATVENHLARSDDDGATFNYVADLYPAVAAPDPEGSGQNGVFGSETASIASIGSGGSATFYGAHLVYFLQPISGYYPKWTTSWHVRVGAASSPQGLTLSDESVLGVTTTASVYQPDARLDQLAGLSIDRCAVLSDPTLFTRNGVLYLIVECMAYNGSLPDFANSTIQVFATTPTGAPSTWTWRHVGVLATDSLAVELGVQTIKHPDVSLAADGTPILVLALARTDPGVPLGTLQTGCVAIELDSIEPPVIRRNCAGRAVVRTSFEGDGMGACTHDAASSSGILTHLKTSNGTNFAIHATGLRP